MSVWAALLLALSVVAEQTPTAVVKAGETVPTFEASDLDGTLRRVDYPEGRVTVLLFFLSSCGTCHKMLPVWSDAYGRRGDHVDVIGVMLDREPPGFFTAMPVTFPVVRAPNREFSRSFRVAKVPMTLRVGPGGLVEEVGQGIVDPITLGGMLRAPR